MNRKEQLVRFSLLLLLAILGLLVMGYHPGLEDDEIYLPAVKSALNPALYPFNSGFFHLQMQATVFDRWMADFIRATHMPTPWAELFWQSVSVLVVLWACHAIACRLFRTSAAQWAAVAMVSALFTLPVSGTALYLMDQHLHPRNLATALILMAVAQVLEQRLWIAALLLAAAVLLHPLMAALGISFCVFLSLALLDPAPAWMIAARRSLAAAVPLGWIFEPASPAWKKALDTRTYYYLYRWTWYEWLGALAPLVLFWLLSRAARSRGNLLLARFAMAVLAYGIFQQALAMAMLTPASLVRLTPLQPMRYLQLVYFFMVLIGGGLIGAALLKNKAWRWAIFLVAVNGGMLTWQCLEFSASQHLEWPGREPSNSWLQAFAWIRTHTPVDAYFALDPNYLEAPAEDYHGFRALAERSQLADAVKDAAAVTQVPELGPVWERQVTAEEGWPRFKRADFERLKAEFGVDWVLVALPQAAGLNCQWHNQSLAVCRIP